MLERFRSRLSLYPLSNKTTNNYHVPHKMSNNEDAFMQEEDVEMEEDSDELIEEEDEEEMNAAGAAAASSEPSEADASLTRRRAIQDIMRDTSLSADEKRFRIQALMSSNRLQVAPPPAPALPAPEANAACVHYERNCNIVAPCCNRIFGCRICHDELSPTGHAPMNRFLIREVVCKNCSTRQAASYVFVAVLDCVLVVCGALNLTRLLARFSFFR